MGNGKWVAVMALLRRDTDFQGEAVAPQPMLEPGKSGKKVNGLTMHQNRPA